MLQPTDEASPDPDPPAASYWDRKVAGICTYGKCGAMAMDDNTLCQSHREEERDRQRRDRSSWGRRARRAGVCAYCPRTKPTKLEPGQRMCLACKVRRRKIGPTLQPTADLESRRVRAATMTRKHADGRTRYHGQGKRGQQPRAQLDRQDLDDALDRISSAKNALAYLETDSAKQLPRIQWKGARDAALGEIALGRRTLDEVLARGQYKVAANVAIDEE